MYIYIYTYNIIIMIKNSLEMKNSLGMVPRKKEKRWGHIGDHAYPVCLGIHLKKLSTDL